MLVWVVVAIPFHFHRQSSLDWVCEGRDILLCEARWCKSHALNWPLFRLVCQSWSLSCRRARHQLACSGGWRCSLRNTVVSRARLSFFHPLDAAWWKRVAVYCLSPLKICRRGSGPQLDSTISRGQLHMKSPPCHWPERIYLVNVSRSSFWFGRRSGSWRMKLPHARSSTLRSHHPRWPLAPPHATH